MAILVLGIGNVLLSDEGIGPYVVGRLVGDYHLPDGVTALDGGTAGMDLLNDVVEAEAVIIVDCARLDAAPGTVRSYVGTAVPAFFQKRISPHQIGLSDLLGACALLGRMPARLALIAIQPESMELGLALTATGRQAAETALALLVEQLAAWGAAPLRKDLPDATPAAFGPLPEMHAAVLAAASAPHHAGCGCMAAGVGAQLGAGD